MIVKGRVESGKHEARFFTLLPKYAKFFRRHLGLLPYPGTLNVKLSKIIRLPYVYIPSSGWPIFWGQVRRLNGLRIEAIGVIPGRPKGRKLEIVSTMKLRNLLGLQDGQEVMLSVEGEEDEEDSRKGRLWCVGSQDPVLQWPVR